MTIHQPTNRPARPFFSSGPCAKRPNWSTSDLGGASLGRSHRSSTCKAKLAKVIDDTAIILGIPKDYKIGIVPASDTGAVEMALWSLLGVRGVDILAWETFGRGWITDVVEQLRLEDVNIYTADYGLLPDLDQVDKTRDVVFTWNGTTSGVKVPDGDWIADDRRGLTICDATSAAFAMDLPWEKLDVTTWSWQKVLGSEAAHGMLVLSPRAVERLENHRPAWPLPKIFRLTKDGKLNQDIFRGVTINTPSMLCVEDVLETLKWAREIGGLAELKNRSMANLKAVEDWIAKTDWVEFLCSDVNLRSNTSICLKLSENCPLQGDARDTAPGKIAALLEQEGIAFDINMHRDAPAGLRLWGGATVDPADMVALMPWLDWAYKQITA